MTTPDTPTLPLEWDDPQDGESLDESAERQRASGCSWETELAQLEGVSK